MTQPKIDHLEAVRPDSIMPATVAGVPCYAFTVKPGDVQVWDSGEGNRGGNGQFNERAEISYAPAPDTEKLKSPANVREGMAQTYDVDYRFKTGWPTHDPAQHAWAVLTQFHEQPGHKGIPGFGGATIRSDAIVFYNPNGDGNYFASVPIKTETWIKLRMAVKWSAGNDGYAKIVDRATGTQIGRWDGPTIAPGEFKYLKQGYYRAGGLPEGTVYETLLDINEGDLTMATTPTPPATPAPTGTMSAAQKADWLKALQDARDAMAAQAKALQASADAITAQLNRGTY